MGKILTAPAQEVTITSDDWEDWEMSGPERYCKIGDVYDVEIDEDGQVEYSKHEKETPELGSSYFIMGSFNEWGYESMEPDVQISGLWVATIEIGPNGSEDFLVNADQDPGRNFYPNTAKCTMKSAEVKGPNGDQGDRNWCIKGNTGDKIRVEFYKSDANTVSISWIKESSGMISGGGLGE